MRLWNLVTGKKAGVLNFDRNILTAVGEGRFASGEGRRVIWDTAGEEFAVGFERGIVVFNIDSKPKAKIAPAPRTKIHQMHYLPSSDEDSSSSYLLVSTEDGRVLVYDTSETVQPTQPQQQQQQQEQKTTKEDTIPASRLVAQIGGPAAGMTGRIKDFEIIPLSAPATFLVVTGCSDGTVRFWALRTGELAGKADAGEAKGFTALQVGTLLGQYSTGTRITCLKSFAMTGTPDQEEEEEEVVVGKAGEDSSSEEEEGDDDDDDDSE